MIFITLLLVWLHPADAADFAIMNRDSFLQQAKQEGLKSFCSDQGMNRCYKIDQDQCKTTFESGFARCRIAVEIPKEVSLLGEDEIILTEMGKCIGAEYSLNHAAKFKEGSQCTVRK